MYPILTEARARPGWKDHMGRVLFWWWWWWELCGDSNALACIAFFRKSCPALVPASLSFRERTNLTCGRLSFFQFFPIHLLWIEMVCPSSSPWQHFAPRQAMTENEGLQRHWPKNSGRAHPTLIRLLILLLGLILYEIYTTEVFPAYLYTIIDNLLLLSLVAARLIKEIDQYMTISLQISQTLWHMWWSTGSAYVGYRHLYWTLIPFCRARAHWFV